MRSYSKLFLITLLALVSTAIGADQMATTPDGHLVRLLEDGSWEYTEVFKLSEDNLERPRVLDQTQPEYTKSAWEAGYREKVVLSCIINREGRVNGCQSLKELEHGLSDRAMSEVIRKWRFEPARMKGQPVSVKVFIEVGFREPECGPGASTLEIEAS